MTHADTIAVRNATLTRVYPLIRMHARKAARTPDDRDDLSHDAVVLFLRRWHKFDGTHAATFAKFAVRSARQYRDQYRRSRPAVTLDDLDPPARGDDADPAFVRAEEAARLGAAVDALPERRRHVVVGRYGLDGRPPRMFKELAGGLGVSTQAVEQQQQKALAQLAADLAGEAIAGE